MSSSAHGIDGLRNSALTGQVIGAAIEVLRRLGPGYIEAMYHNALCIELSKRGISFTKEHDVPVYYDDVEIGVHRLDLLVEDSLVVELKTVATIHNNHVAVVRSYLRAMEIEDGLVLNFAKSTIEIRRVGGRNGDRPASSPDLLSPAGSPT